MTDHLDVQMYPNGVAIITPEGLYDENLPGQINLSTSEADALRHMLNEAWLNSHGLERISVSVDRLEPGDILPDLGLTVRVYPEEKGGNIWTVYTTDQSELYLNGNLELAVHRRIE